MVTTIGIDPHKATHTAVAIDESETVLDEITVAADRYQTKKLIDWASELDGDGCLWAVEAAGGLGYLLSQQLIANGEQVVPGWQCEDHDGHHSRISAEAIARLNTKTAVKMVAISMKPSANIMTPSKTGQCRPGTGLPTRWPNRRRRPSSRLCRQGRQTARR